MTTPRTLVLADFDRRRMERHAEALEAAGWAVVRVQGGKAAQERAAATGAQVLVAEAFLPDGNGLEAAAGLSGDRRTQGTRALVLLDAEDKYGARRATETSLKTLVRPFTPEELVVAVTELAAEASMARGTPRPTPSLLDDLQSGPRIENPVLRHLTDAVTGLWNAPYGALKLADEIKRARRFGTPLSVVALGFDGTSTPEDAIRRRLLTEVAGILLCESRDIDHLGRSDDDGFLLILPHTDANGASVMASRVISTVEKRGIHSGTSAGIVTMSGGIAGFQADLTPAPEDLIQAAATALDQARRLGGNRLAKWSDGTP